MKPINLLFSGLSLLISSCSQIYFTDPQPVEGLELSIVPVELQGTFICEADQDTVTFDSQCLTSSNKHYCIGRDLIIRKQNEKYFINVSDRPPYWELGIATQLNTSTWQVETFAFDPESPGPFIQEINKITPLTPLESHYVANPSKKQFDRMLQSKWLYTTVFEKTGNQ